MPAVLSARARFAKIFRFSGCVRVPCHSERSRLLLDPSLSAPGSRAFICAAASAGAFGVDLFFALSAYLITILLIREEEIRGQIDIRAFYVRRILRIWPLYFFFIAVSALVPLWIELSSWAGTTLPAFFCSQGTGSTSGGDCHTPSQTRSGVSRLKSSFTFSGRSLFVDCHDGNCYTQL